MKFRGFTLIRLLLLRKRSCKGFTLIELLVVIAIISILSVIGFATFGNSQSSTKDSRRKGDVNAISKAYEANLDSTTGEYKTLADSQFTGGKIPTPPEGGSYLFVTGPDATTKTNTDYKVCTLLDGGDATKCNATAATTDPVAKCFCQQSSQGLASGTIPSAPPAPPAPAPACYTIANGAAPGSAAANTAWVNWWNSLPVTASKITISANGGVKNFTTTSSANAQSMLTKMKGVSQFSIADNGVNWAGAFGNTTTSCGSSFNFGIQGPGGNFGCSCDAQVLIIPGYTTTSQVLCGACSNTCTGQTQVCVTP